MNKNQYDYYNAWDSSVPYKGLLFYPVTSEFYMDFHMCSNCIVINKNEIPNTDVIKMSYLDFIFWYSSQSEEHSIFQLFLVKLLSMCLCIDENQIEIFKDIDNKFKLRLPVEYKKTDENGDEIRFIQQDIFDSNDFNEFREIICEQNGIELEEKSTINPEVKKALDEALAFKNKNKKKMCSFNAQIICVMITMHETDKQKIKQMTIKTFTEILQRYDTKLHYEIYRQAEMSGQVTFKEEIDHWMSESSKSLDDRYKDAIVDYDNFSNKIEGQVK